MQLTTVFKPISSEHSEEENVFYRSILTDYFKRNFPAQFKYDTDTRGFNKRLSEALVIKHNGDRVVGCLTAYIKYDETLRENMFIVRSSVDRDFRRAGVSSSLIELAVTYLAANNKEKCLGVLFEIENNGLIDNQKGAFWKNTRAIYLGYDRNGKQRRAIFFEDATLSHIN